MPKIACKPNDIYREVLNQKAQSPEYNQMLYRPPSWEQITLCFGKLTLDRHPNEEVNLGEETSCFWTSAGMRLNLDMQWPLWKSEDGSLSSTMLLEAWQLHRRHWCQTAKTCCSFDFKNDIERGSAAWETACLLYIISLTSIKTSGNEILVLKWTWEEAVTSTSYELQLDWLRLGAMDCSRR